MKNFVFALQFYDDTFNCMKQKRLDIKAKTYLQAWKTAIETISKQLPLANLESIELYTIEEC